MRRFLRAVALLCLGVLGTATCVAAPQLTLTWADNSSNEAGFRIERAREGDAFAVVRTVGANEVTFTDTDLEFATSYSYRVQAFNAAGSSGYSNIATAKTPSAPPPQSNAAPTIADIPNQWLFAGGSTGAIAFSIGDVETAASALTVTVQSTNLTLIPLSAIVLNGTGASRTVNVTPVAGRTGVATVTLTVSDGVLTASDSFVVTVNAVGTGPVITVQPQATTIAPGSALTLSVAATGSSTVSYQWYLNNVPIAGATASTYTIPIAQRSDAGSYHVVVTSAGVPVKSSAVTVTAGTTSSSGHIANLSTRALVQTGDSLLIPGFVVTGGGTKRLLLRMVGPALSSLGLQGVIPDPMLVLKRKESAGFVDVASNMDWSEGGNASMLSQVFGDLGAFPFSAGSGDSAMVVELGQGIYSVLATDEQVARTGLSLVEIYDVDGQTSDTRITNLSTRGYLGSGDNLMIMGFVIENGPVTVLLRSVGPGLRAFGVANLVSNSRIELMRVESGTSRLIAANDDWNTSGDVSYTTEITSRVSAFPLEVGSRDAAMVVTLPPGVYSLVTKGVGETTGIALVEMYVVP